MTSRFAVLPVRPTGKLARATAQEQAGGRARWNGVLPLRTLLVEQPDDAGEPTGFWLSNLPASPPIADLVRFAKMRRRIEHDYANSNTAWAWTTSRPAPGAAGTTTSPSSPPPRPSSPSGGFTQKHRLQPEPLPSPRHSAGHAAVLDRHLHHHLRPTTHQSQNLTKHY
ncbi:hypothetical protein ACH4D5_24140 [Streptomyces sp. NPDC018029]|uniref:hypothetical protein n=1 Tax=Streptomyces sp. NPDC018029 TaxID=3365032 RepID=UPI003793B0A0